MPSRSRRVDPGIGLALQRIGADIETCESCEGGPGHCLPTTLLGPGPSKRMSRLARTGKSHSADGWLSSPCRTPKVLLTTVPVYAMPGLETRAARQAPARSKPIEQRRNVDQSQKRTIPRRRIPEMAHAIHSGWTPARRRSNLRVSQIARSHLPRFQHAPAPSSLARPSPLYAVAGIAYGRERATHRPERCVARLALTA